MEKDWSEIEQIKDAHNQNILYVEIKKLKQLRQHIVNAQSHCNNRGVKQSIEEGKHIISFDSTSFPIVADTDFLLHLREVYAAEVNKYLISKEKETIDELSKYTISKDE